jgi:hypothetical protein
MTLAEAKAIALRLSVSWQEFVADYLDPRWPGKDTFLARHMEGKCVFLDMAADSKFGLCRIHTFKPRPCIDWQAGAEKKECQQGLLRYWNLKIGEDGTMRGSQPALNNFQTFIESMTRRKN